MLDQRSLAEKSADLELELIRAELLRWAEKLRRAGVPELEVRRAFREQLERLAHLYRELYEIGEG